MPDYALSCDGPNTVHIYVVSAYLTYLTKFELSGVAVPQRHWAVNDSAAILGVHRVWRSTAVEGLGSQFVCIQSLYSFHISAELAFVALLDVA